MSGRKTPEARARHAAYARDYRRRNVDKVRAIEKASRSRTRRVASLTEEQRAQKRDRDYRWRKNNPKRVAAHMRKWREKAGLVRQPAVASNAACLGDWLYATIWMLVKIPDPDMRDDVVSDVYLGVLEGRYPLEVTAEHVRKETALHNRQFRDRDMLSLNASYGSQTLGEIIGAY